VVQIGVEWCGEIWGYDARNDPRKDIKDAILVEFLFIIAEMVDLSRVEISDTTDGGDRLFSISQDVQNA
jgi:hypothetical protein